MEMEEKIEKVRETMWEILKHVMSVKYDYDKCGEKYDYDAYNGYSFSYAVDILEAIGEDPCPPQDVWDRVREITKNSDNEKWLNLTVAQLLCIANNHCEEDAIEEIGRKVKKEPEVRYEGKSVVWE